MPQDEIENAQRLARTDAYQLSVGIGSRVKYRTGKFDLPEVAMQLAVRFAIYFKLAAPIDH